MGAGSREIAMGLRVSVTGRLKFKSWNVLLEPFAPFPRGKRFAVESV